MQLDQHVESRQDRSHQRPDFRMGIEIAGFTSPASRAKPSHNLAILTGHTVRGPSVRTEIATFPELIRRHTPAFDDASIIPPNTPLHVLQQRAWDPEKIDRTHERAAATRPH